MQRDELDDLKDRLLQVAISQQLPQQQQPRVPDPPKVLGSVQAVIGIIVGVVTLLTSIVIVTNYVSSIESSTKQTMEVRISKVREEMTDKISIQKDSIISSRLELERSLRVTRTAADEAIDMVEDLEQDVKDLDEQIRLLKGANDNMYREITYLKSQQTIK